MEQGRVHQIGMLGKLRMQHPVHALELVQGISIDRPHGAFQCEAQAAAISLSASRAGTGRENRKPCA